jgi:hypothetical protein
MKKSIILLLLLVSFTCIQARNVIYRTSDSIKVVKILRQAQLQPRQSNFQLFFARKFLNIPYVGGTLDICDDEHLVINLRQMDCTTLVENVTALTICAQRRMFTFRDYCTILTSLRYRSGHITDYTSRLHYFTQWIVDNKNKGLVNEIQNPDPPFSATQMIDLHFMSTHVPLYHSLTLHPEYVSIIKKYEDSFRVQKFKYIPKSLIEKNVKSLRTVQDGDIIAITTSKDGLDIAHVGIAVWHKDGLHLLNASQIHHKVVEESMTLGQYLKKHPSHTGIRIVRIIK